MKVERIQPGNERWDQVVRSFPDHNVYQTSTYHVLASEKTGARPVMLVFEDQRTRVAVPLLLRTINVDVANNQLQDVTSVYGYPGILTSSQEPDESFCSSFRDALRQEMDEQKIVSFFVRLGIHEPVNGLLKDLGQLDELGPAVIVDLAVSDDDRRLGYRRNHRIDIQMLRKQNAETFDDPGFAHLTEFENAYAETMKRVGAVSWFNFGIEHFQKLCGDLTEEVVLLHTTVDGTYSCGGMFFRSNDTVYAHLVGTGNDWVSHSPTKILFDDAASHFRNCGCKQLVLGGGVGCRKDNLFRFKSGFSNLTQPFRVWKWVVNPSVYSKLCQSKTNGKDDNRKKLFFPMYRDAEPT